MACSDRKLLVCLIPVSILLIKFANGFVQQKHPSLSIWRVNPLWEEDFGKFKAASTSKKSPINGWMISW